MSRTPGLENIRWVVFDAVGTVIFADPPVHMAYHRIGRMFGCSVTPEQALRRFRDSARGVTVSLEVDPLATTEELEREFWRRTVADVLPDAEPAEACFAELHEHFARPESWGCYMDVAETVEALSEHGIKLALASNFDARLHSVCEGHPELASIATRVISSEVGWKKPSPHFFAALIAACNARPDEILMVGDDMTNDVQPALKAGMRALYLDRSGRSPAPAIANFEQLLECLAITPAD